MIPKEAIEKAIEGGYRLPEPCYIEGIKVYHSGTTLLDPLFWQALGKALGWTKKSVPAGMDMEYTIPEWEWQSKRLFDLIITGGSTDQFWEELLK